MGGGVQFLSPFLCEQFDAIQGGKCFESMPLSEIAEIGPDGRKIRGAYEHQDTPTRENWKALWDHKTNIRQTMSGKPDAYITAKKGKEDDARRLWAQRANLLLPTRMRLTVVCRFAVRMETKVVSSAWVPCKPYDNKKIVEKAICVYLNSTLGILTLLGERSNKSISYPQMALDTLRKLNFPKFTTDAAGQLAHHYDQHKLKELQPLPKIKECLARRSLDKKVAELLDLDAEWINDLREELAKEPSITGKRYKRMRRNN